MKPSVEGIMNIPFKYEIDYMDRQMAILQAAYRLHEDVVEKVEIIVTNIHGERTIVKALDWDIEFMDVVDEHGFSID